MSALIAAGEVVDRPASVVKELVENALDAGARAISVELRQGGLDLIRVSDDGHGLSRADAQLAPQRFTTSKVAAAADLNAIRTLGFRGEALSSIAAVGRLEILTRQTDDVEGSRVIATADASDPHVEPAASPAGTQVTVTNLFAAFPARRKFLKSPLRETELAQQAVARYALAYPQVAFRFMAEGRERLTLPPGSALERVGAILGREVAGDMLGLSWEALDLRVHGFISRPALARSRRDGQYFFVNGRPIRAGLLAVMLERPYAGLLPPGRYPLAVIHVGVEPGFVDVNTHPQKAEIRFSQERSVYGAVSQAVSQALLEFPRQPAAGLVEFAWPFAGFQASPALQERGTAYETGSLRPLAQLQNTYILAQSAEGLVIIDQHAAHEQILYQQLQLSANAQPPASPAQLQLTAREAELLAANLPLFTHLGFEIEPFGGNTFLIRTLPAGIAPHLHRQVAYQATPDVSSLLTTLLEELQRYPRATDDERQDRLAQKTACVSAIKAGDVLTAEQMQQILTDLAEAWSPAVCPHGRPAFVTVSIEELERRFGRR